MGLGGKKLRLESRGKQGRLPQRCFGIFPLVTGAPEIGALVETKFEMGSVALRQWDRTAGFADLGRKESWERATGI